MFDDEFIKKYTDSSSIVVVDKTCLMESGNPRFIEKYLKYNYALLFNWHQNSVQNFDIRVIIPNTEPFYSTDFRCYVNDFDSEKCRIIKLTKDLFNLDLSERILRFCLLTHVE